MTDTEAPPTPVTAERMADWTDRLLAMEREQTLALQASGWVSVGWVPAKQRLWKKTLPSGDNLILSMMDALRMEVELQAQGQSILKY